MIPWVPAKNAADSTSLSSPVTPSWPLGADTRHLYCVNVLLIPSLEQMLPVFEKSGCFGLHGCNISNNINAGIISSVPKVWIYEYMNSAWIPTVNNLKIRPWCQTLSKTLATSRKTTSACFTLKFSLRNFTSRNSW